MSRRRSYDVASLPHRSAIPAATQVGPMVWSSPVAPTDTATGMIPDDPDVQIENVFTNIGVVLDAVGIGYEQLGRVEFLLGDDADRPGLNRAWERWFPDPTSRPARYVQPVTSLPPGIRLMATFQAWAGEDAGSAPHE